MERVKLLGQCRRRAQAGLERGKELIESNPWARAGILLLCAAASLSITMIVSVRWQSPKNSAASSLAVSVVEPSSTTATAAVHALSMSAVRH
jgi:hypothetical protein